MLSASEIRLLGGVLLALLIGWAVMHWRDDHRIEPLPAEPALFDDNSPDAAPNLQ